MGVYVLSCAFVACGPRLSILENDILSRCRVSGLTLIEQAAKAALQLLGIPHDVGLDQVEIAEQIFVMDFELAREKVELRDSLTQTVDRRPDFMPQRAKQVLLKRRLHLDRLDHQPHLFRDDPHDFTPMLLVITGALVKKSYKATQDPCRPHRNDANRLEIAVQ